MREATHVRYRQVKETKVFQWSVKSPLQVAGTEQKLDGQPTF